ncbi:unnamed protein product [Amoebophrya sp. A120]|nr:unnamed protein product [Amoebophrya sp. A120]|eukprot:GSA120T00024048001.1
MTSSRNSPSRGRISLTALPASATKPPALHMSGGYTSLPGGPPPEPRSSGGNTKYLFPGGAQPVSSTSSTQSRSRHSSANVSPILRPSARIDRTSSGPHRSLQPGVPSGPLAEALLTTERLRGARLAFEANDKETSTAVHQKLADHIRNGTLPPPHDEKTLEEGEYVRPAVFGGLDGISTSFAFLAGAVGVNLSVSHLVALGLAQVFAGAFSMAFGEYVSSKAERQIALRELNREKWEVENFPEGEIAEMIQIYMQHGLNIEDAQKVAFTLSKYPKFWVEHMLLHEIGILPPDADEDGCWKSALAMFVAFVVFGLVPVGTYLLVELLFGNATVQNYGFLISCVASLATLFLLGYWKNKIAESSPWSGGCWMLFQGAVAGTISFFIGVYLGGGDGGGGLSLSY